MSKLVKMVLATAGLAGLLLGATAGNVLAQSGQDYNCEDPGYQQEMNYCAYQDFVEADRMLNAEYQKAIAQAKELDRYGSIDDQSAEGVLRQAQRAWVAFRDANCLAEGFVAHGGTMEPMLVDGCKARVTLHRIKELKSYVEMISGP